MTMNYIDQAVAAMYPPALCWLANACLVGIHEFEIDSIKAKSLYKLAAEKFAIAKFELVNRKLVRDLNEQITLLFGAASQGFEPAAKKLVELSKEHSFVVKKVEELKQYISRNQIKLVSEYVYQYEYYCPLVKLLCEEFEDYHFQLEKIQMKDHFSSMPLDEKTIYASLSQLIIDSRGEKKLNLQLEVLMAAANAGIAFANVLLGICYLRGVAEDRYKAKEFFKKAADKLNADGLYYYALLLEKEASVYRHGKNELQYFQCALSDKFKGKLNECENAKVVFDEKALNNEIKSDVNSLAICYLQGWGGFKEDFIKAKNLFATMLHNMDASYYYGVCLEKETSLNKAKVLYKLADCKGHALVKFKTKYQDELISRYMIEKIYLDDASLNITSLPAKETILAYYQNESKQNDPYAQFQLASHKIVSGKDIESGATEMQRLASLGYVEAIQFLLQHSKPLPDMCMPSKKAIDWCYEFDGDVQKCFRAVLRKQEILLESAANTATIISDLKLAPELVIDPVKKYFDELHAYFNKEIGEYKKKDEEAIVKAATLITNIYVFSRDKSKTVLSSLSEEDDVRVKSKVVIIPLSDELSLIKSKIEAVIHGSAKYWTPSEWFNFLLLDDMLMIDQPRSPEVLATLVKLKNNRTFVDVTHKNALNELSVTRRR